MVEILGSSGNICGMSNFQVHYTSCINVLCAFTFIPVSLWLDRHQSPLSISSVSDLSSHIYLLRLRWIFANFRRAVYLLEEYLYVLSQNRCPGRRKHFLVNIFHSLDCRVTNCLAVPGLLRTEWMLTSVYLKDGSPHNQSF